MRLIDADALIDDLMERYCKECNKRRGIKNGKWRIIYEIGEAPCRACEVDDVKAELEEAPTVEVEPIKRGHWKAWDLTWGRSIYACTSCGDAMEVPTENGNPIFAYCPNCGARMDEKGEEQ